MKKSILALLAITTLFFGACKKDNDDDKPRNDTYQPFTSGSVWKYRNTTKAGATTNLDTTISTMTAGTKTINAKKFHVLSSIDGLDTTETYIGLNNNVYSTFFDSGEGDSLEVAYLNDKKNVGDTWITAITVEDEVEAQLKTTVVEKGITKAILNKTYNNIIHTKVEMQFKIAGNFTTISTMDYYTAKGIGVVGTYVKVGAVETLKSELFSYNIK